MICRMLIVLKDISTGIELVVCADTEHISTVKHEVFAIHLYPVLADYRPESTRRLANCVAAPVCGRMFPT